MNRRPGGWGDAAFVFLRELEVMPPILTMYGRGKFCNIPLPLLLMCG